MTEALSIADGYEQLYALVENSVHSLHSRRAYRRALREFFAWREAEGSGPINKAVIQQYRAALEASGKASSTINQSLAAIRRLLVEASDNGLLDPQIAAAAARVKGAPIRGVRAGKWLTAEQAIALLHAPDAATLKGKRDRAILAVLIGCGLRREELAHLRLCDLEEREGRCVIPELVGKGHRVRLTPVPGWVKKALDAWTSAAGIADGRLFRSIRKGARGGGDDADEVDSDIDADVERGDIGTDTSKMDVAGQLRAPNRRLGASLSVKAIWQIVRKYAQEIGVDCLGPHDLRRTCARLCNDAGGDLVQIQMLLGHSSAEVTRRYIGGGQKIKNAVNDTMLGM